MIVAAAKSSSIGVFYAIGLVFAAWAVLVGVTGIRRSAVFVQRRGQAFALIAISVTLAVASITAAVLTAG